MFSMPDHGTHSKRKRMLSNVYAKSTLQNSEAMNTITEKLLNEDLVPRLREVSKKGEPVEFYNVFCAAAMDFVAAYVFGLKNASHFLQEPTMGAKFFRDYKARAAYTFWPQDMPRFTAFMSKLGLGHCLVPLWVNQANQDIEAWLIAMCDKAEQTLQHAELEGKKGQVEDYPTVYAHLRNSLLKETQTKSSTSPPASQAVDSNRLAVASEMLDHTLAGFDTSSIALTFLTYELSLPQHAHWQRKLQAELAPLNGSRDAKSLDALPILHAILMETLRLHASIPGNQPRITPANATLGADRHTVTGLPPNVRVQAQAWSLHRNPDVFPDPEAWNPARWLERSERSELEGNENGSTPEQLREMQRWFWAFGSGGRMCVGSNLAMLDMKAIIAGIWGSFGTVLVDGRGMVHNGGYVAEPVGWEGKFCLVRLEEL